MKISTKLSFTVFVLAPMLVLAQEADFSGMWERNARLSQDPFEKIEMALGMQQRGEGGQQSSPMNRGVFLRDNRAALLRSLLDYAEVLDVMEVEHAQGEMKISVGEGDEFFSLFYLDGKPHARQLPDGLRVEATATLDGTDVRIEQKGEEGGVLSEVFSLLSDGKQLAVIFRLESKISETPVLIRTVYDRAESE